MASRMGPVTIESPGSAQEIQDQIFRQMSADEKVRLGAEFWKTARELAGQNWKHVISQRSQKTSGQNLPTA